MGKRAFGQITRLPSKRFRARYTGPDANLHNAPQTFDTREDAEAWLAGERRRISEDRWTPPTKLRDLPREKTFGEYASQWLERRDLKPRTRAHYESLLDRQIMPTFDVVPLVKITRSLVRDWYDDLDRSKPTLRAHAYGLLRTILASAVDEERIPTNPCQIKKAGTTKRARKIRTATVEELVTIAQAMPKKYGVMLLLSSWCMLRFGEVTELRRKDVDVKTGVLHVRRGVVRADGQTIVGPPKSDAGVRDVAIPPHILPILKEHIDSMPMRGRDALLFPAADGQSHIAPSTLYRVFYPAREAAGRPDLRWHDLRHTGSVMAAQTGATVAELMARGGWSTSTAAMRYQHAAQGRDTQIAAGLSKLAEGN